MARKGYKQKEITLVKAFVKWLNEIDGCLAYKRAAGLDRRGKSDVTGCIHGIRIEVVKIVRYCLAPQKPLLGVHGLLVIHGQLSSALKPRILLNLKRHSSLSVANAVEET